jgi:hypothetical protein
MMSGAMRKPPPREPLYVIDVAKECFEVAEGDVDHAMMLFRQIIPDVDENLQQVVLKHWSVLAWKRRTGASDDQ